MILHSNSLGVLLTFNMRFILRELYQHTIRDLYHLAALSSWNNLNEMTYLGNLERLVFFEWLRPRADTIDHWTKHGTSSHFIYIQNYFCLQFRYIRRVQ